MRTFLVAWLRARASAGELVLRTEDLDTPRNVPGADESIMEDLRWLGFDWDEGPDVRGASGPYVQSERQRFYDDALRSLVAVGAVYPCTCSRKEIGALASAPHGLEELGVPYPGTCRNGPGHPERAPSLRFRMPNPAPSFVDGVHGTVEVPESAFDFVLRRADGVYAYQLAVVVDDQAMGVTEVVRGADLLTSTPRQLALHRALGREPPGFLHVPVVLSSSGARLAKRDHALAIAELRSAGRTREEIISRAAASLGLVGEGERVSLADLVETFDVARIPRESYTLREWK